VHEAEECLRERLHGKVMETLGRVEGLMHAVAHHTPDILERGFRETGELTLK
jgi:hypothetical protein